MFARDIRSWGPAGWRFLMAIALTYPSTPSENDKQTYGTFFRTCGMCLPCSLCRDHFAKFVSEHPIALDSARALISWLLALHNEINRENNKPEWSFEQVLGTFMPWQLARAKFGLDDAESARVALFNRNVEQQEQDGRTPTCASSSSAGRWLLPLLLSLLIVIALAILYAVARK